VGSNVILFITDPVGATLVVARKEVDISKGEDKNLAGTRPATTLGQIVGVFKVGALRVLPTN
jgi:hypothetical protein